jgi:hypothetical protein
MYQSFNLWFDEFFLTIAYVEARLGVYFYLVTLRTEAA